MTPSHTSAARRLASSSACAAIRRSASCSSVLRSTTRARWTSGAQVLLYRSGYLHAKILSIVEDSQVSGIRIADYGSRRRFSRQWHEEVLQTLRREVPQYFAGTSNVWFAMRNSLTPLGTMAHEYMQACQALGPRLRDSQVFAFDKWAQEYRGDLGIALSDTYGFDAFLRHRAQTGGAFDARGVQNQQLSSAS